MLIQQTIYQVQTLISHRLTNDEPEVSYTEIVW